MFLLRWATAPIRWFIKVILFVVAVLILYFVVTLVQVWLTSLQYSPVHAGAIMVMGAAQYNGVPSNDLKARLNEAFLLYQDGYSKLIICTGFKEPGDTYTEAEAGKMYLESKGVPGKDILEAGGTDTWGNVSEAVPKLKARGVTTVLVVTDPFHEALSMAMTSSLGLKPHPTPTKSSPIGGTSLIPNFLKEAAAVGLGRVIGWSHIHSVLGSL